MRSVPASWVFVEVPSGGREVVVTVGEDSIGLVCARSECARRERFFGGELRKLWIGICVVSVASVLVCRTRGGVP